MRSSRFVLAFLLLAATCLAARFPSLTVVQWSDIHYGNDEYKPAAFEEACQQGLAMHPDVVVLSGDQLDNKCSAAEFEHRLATFPPVLAARVQVPVVLALGNNDGRENYQTSPDTLAETLSYYRKAFGAACYLDDLGNGVLPQEVGGLRWISINSVVFSGKDHYAGRKQQEDATLTWLDAQVQKVSANQPVVLVMHVPPVKDILDEKDAWDSSCIVRLESILDRHAGPSYVLAGHFHRNEVHALPLPSGRAVPVLLAGSLSGKFGGYPNWRFYHWQTGAHHQVTDMQYTVRYPGHPDWETHYDVSNPAAPSTYDDMATRLSDDHAWYEQYATDFYAHNPDEPQWIANPITHLDMVHELLETP